MGKAIISGGAVMVAPVGGTPIADVAVGSTLKLKENGKLVDYLVVHNGKPSSIYNASCDGIWLLRKDIYTSRQWHSSNSNVYASSSIHSWLNNTFINVLDESIRNAIKQVMIPYTAGEGTAGSVKTGANGLSAKVFLLAALEAGLSQYEAYMRADGSILSYFNSNSNIAYYNGTATLWTTRTPYGGHERTVWSITAAGASELTNCAASAGIRPAFILPKTALITESGTIVA